MCGITSYVGHRPADELLLSGLEQLEYRGYDSAGITCWTSRAAFRPYARSATSRAPRRRLGARTAGCRRRRGHPAHDRHRAHPLGDTRRRDREPTPIHTPTPRAVPYRAQWHHRELRRTAPLDGRRGRDIRSETDAEVVAHLIAYHDRGDVAQAVRRAVREVHGHYAFVVDVRRAARGCWSPHDSPARWSSAPQTMGISSPRPSQRSSPDTREVHEVADGEVVVATAERAEFFDAPRVSRDENELPPSTGSTTSPRRAATRRSCSRRSDEQPRRGRGHARRAARRGRRRARRRALADLERRSVGS